MRLSPLLFREGVIRGAFAALALWPVLAFVLYSVFVRIQSKYFAALLSASGLDGDASTVHQVFLYRYDLLLIGVAGPLALAASFVLMRRRAAVWMWALLILSAQALLYANLQSWGQVGRFLNWQALVNAIAFGLSKPEFIGDYLALDGLAKLTVLLVASAVVLGLAIRLRDGSWVLRLGGALSLLGGTTALAAAAYGHASSMKPAPITGSFLVNAVDALAFDESKKPLPVSAADIGARFERVSGAALDEFRGPNFGSAAGMNLLLFVIETGSIEFLDVREQLPAHPVLQRLKPHLFVAKNHFSTFPASAESNLSLLTGLYPPRALYDTCLIDAGDKKGERPPVLPGVVPALRAKGYKTALYAPFRSQVPADKVVFEMTGFERVFYGQDHDPGVGGSDKRTFQELLKDVSGWAKSGQRFAAAFFPQIGHGPWSPDLGATIRERGARLATLQLDWLQQIVTELEQAGQLERTVIVFTGDHGVRTSLEDPRVRVGMVDQYSYHVPLLVYAPKASYEAVDTTALSSHVDLAVELAQLFGVPRTPAMQGLAFQHPQRRVRRQFLIANWYYGADGYVDPNESAMYSVMLDTAYRRGDRRVSFAKTDLVREAAATQRIRSTVEEMLDLQEAWIRLRACEPMLARR